MNCRSVASRETTLSQVKWLATEQRKKSETALGSVIGLKNSCHFLHQSDTKPNNERFLQLALCIYLDFYGFIVLCTVIVTEHND